MTKMQSLILEINKLNDQELELLLKEILRRIDRRKRAEAALNKFVGIGKGVWDIDAQKHIDELREGDRL